ALVRVRVWGLTIALRAAVKVALTALAELIDTSQVPSSSLILTSLAQPSKPVSFEPVAALAESTIVVSDGREAVAEVQVLPQATPLGFDFTAPAPTLVSVSVFLGKARNSASTFFASDIETTHLPSGSDSHPLQPTNSEPAEGSAVSVTRAGALAFLAGGEVSPP